MVPEGIVTKCGIDRGIHCLGIGVGIFHDTTTFEVFELLDVSELATINAFFIVYISRRIRHGYHLAAQLKNLLYRKLGHIP